MTDLISSQPDFSALEVAKWVESRFGLQVALERLDSERDQNFLATECSGSRKYVVKIGNSQSDLGFIELENQAMLRLAETEIGDLVPQPMRGTGGNHVELLETQAGRFPVRVVRYLPGEVLARVHPQTEALLFEVGALMGVVAGALGDLKHPSAQREFHWDLDKVFPTLVKYRSFAAGFPEIDIFMNRYQARVLPRLDSLRKSIIHNDGNDHNIIVNSSQEPIRKVSGLIDFGDMVFSSTVNELAIAVAYVMLGKTDPVGSASHVVRGFHEKYELNDEELGVVFDLACMRLCTSVVMAGYQRSLNPGNAYLSVTDLPAQDLLKDLTQVDSEFAACYFRSVCGRDPLPSGKQVESWLQRKDQSFHPVLGFPLSGENVHVFDLSVSSSDPVVGELGPGTSERLFAELSNRNKQVGVGRYAEPRTCYQGEQFQSAGELEQQPRTIHMGVDLFVPAGTPLFAPLEGEVHSFADNDQAFDYGPTIILKHQVDDISFFSLYGHLSRASLSGIREGQSIQQGEEFAAIGPSTENGGWPPHLHFQLMTHDLGLKGNYPGVVRVGELALWKSLLPDPNWILQIPGECFPPETTGQQEIAAQRERWLNPSLSLSYDTPLHIVRGKSEYLYDADGRPYLDCVNNVCHVGHCHPHVVAAASRQLAVLNTNTRYLHDQVVNYAERLAATLPGKLDVCYFVNSGSEANDLALRLARNYTGRQELICVDGAYHGNMTSLIEISPYKFDSPGGQGKPDAVHMVAMPDLYRGLHREEDLDVSPARFYAEGVRKAIEASAASQDAVGPVSLGDHQVAAFICESILSCAGQIILPDEYLQLAYQIAREQNVVCIADEVQVGFGRVGEKFWAFETQGVVPDIVTLGKPIGNGFPLGAVVTTREIADAFDNGMEYFNTFGGNPVSCAVGNAVLDVIENQDLVENARQVGSYFMEELKQLQSDHQSMGDVRGMGLFLGIEFVVDRQARTPNPQLANYVVERMKNMGILLSRDGAQQNVIKIKPPIVFGKKEVDLVISRLSRILEEDFPSSFEK